MVPRGRNTWIGSTQLLFVRIIAVLGAQAGGVYDFQALAFDCAASADINMYNRSAHCKYSQEVYGKKTSLQILQHVETETVNGFKCQVTVHRKLYYCWMFSYSKPIIRAEYKQWSFPSNFTQRCQRPSLL